MITTSFKPAINALLQAMRHQEIVSHYRLRKVPRRFAPRNRAGIARMFSLEARARGGQKKIPAHTAQSCDVLQIFLARDSRSDLGVSSRTSASIIFLLTSFCVDSIHSNSCNRSPLRNSMKNGKGE